LPRPTDTPAYRPERSTSVVEIVNVLREQVPALRFIGRRYTHADRDATGGFTARW